MKQTLLLLCFLVLSNLASSQKKDSLKVISWNVFLRPAILKDQQLKRVDSIAAKLLAIDADVLVLQEVFHKKSRRRLINALSKSYPYHSKMGRKTFWGVPSGNCIFSKDSIRSQKFVYYKRAIKADKMAKKGVILVEIEHDGSAFQIYGTHLQAGGASEGVKVRRSQINQIRDMVRLHNKNKTALFAGDFNITYEDSLYHYAVETLSSKNVPPSNQELGTSNLAGHSLTNVAGNPKWIDFILLKSDNTIDFRSSRIEEPRCYFKAECERVSDHNPIITVFEW